MMYVCVQFFKEYSLIRTCVEDFVNCYRIVFLCCLNEMERVINVSENQRLFPC